MIPTIRPEDATRKKATESFGKLLDARAPSKRQATLLDAMIVETTMLTALSYLGHALPTLEASTDPRMEALARQVRVMLDMPERPAPDTQTKPQDAPARKAAPGCGCGSRSSVRALPNPCRSV